MIQFMLKCTINGKICSSRCEGNFKFLDMGREAERFYKQSTGGGGSSPVALKPARTSTYRTVLDAAVLQEDLSKNTKRTSSLGF